MQSTRTQFAQLAEPAAHCLLPVFCLRPAVDPGAKRSTTRHPKEKTTRKISFVLSTLSTVPILMVSTNLPLRKTSSTEQRHAHPRNEELRHRQSVCKAKLDDARVFEEIKLAPGIGSNDRKMCVKKATRAKKTFQRLIPWIEM